MAMIGYGIALLPLAEQLRQEEKEALAPFYANDLGLDGLAWLNTRLLKVVMDRETDRDHHDDDTRGHVHTLQQAVFVNKCNPIPTQHIHQHFNPFAASLHSNHSIMDF